jgi:hypothetical protein
MSARNFASLSKRKDFRKYPELLDIHVERLLAANENVGAYMKDSELLKSGFIKAEKFAGCAQEVLNDLKSAPVGKRSNASRVDTGTCADRVLNQIKPIIKDLFQPAAQEDIERIFYQQSFRQHLLNSPDDKDDQKVFHTDTFFHCVKFWYFPHAVSEEEGAFWYVPFSPVVTDNILDWHRARVEDLKNSRAEDWRGAGHIEGSFRISEDEIKGLGLTAIPVVVEPDTLVVANVFGFHRRGDVKKPTNRLSIHGSIRLEPFLY